jgi:hypothetical protein
MSHQTLRTVWFSKGSLITIGVMIPAWAFGAILWGLGMAIFMKGNPLGWMIAAFFWGISCWFFTAIFALIGLRELVVRIPPVDPNGLGDRLAEALKKMKYVVQQTAPFSYICKPTRGLFRNLVELNTLQVHVHQQGVDLIGPAVLVNRVRKHLLKP